MLDEHDSMVLDGITVLHDYRGLFDELANVASFGDTARDLLHRLAHDYRSLN